MVGDPMDPATEVGPLATRGQLQDARTTRCERSWRAGARLLTGGKRPAGSRATSTRPRCSPTSAPDSPARARGAVRPGGAALPGAATSTRRSRSPTTRPSAWAPASGPRDEAEQARFIGGARGRHGLRQRHGGVGPAAALRRREALGLRPRAGRRTGSASSSTSRRCGSVAERGDPTVETEAGSFRDPAGFVFQRDGVLYRQVNLSFQPKFSAVRTSGLFDELARDGSWSPTTKSARSTPPGPMRSRCSSPSGSASSPTPTSGRSASSRTRRCSRWSAGARAGAGLHPARRERLQRPVPRRAADPHRHALVRAAAERASRGSAYRQFCEHFLVPLALMSRVDVRLRAAAPGPPRRHSARARLPPAAAADAGCGRAP